MDPQTMRNLFPKHRSTKDLANFDIAEKPVSEDQALVLAIDNNMSPEATKDYGPLELNSPSKPEVEFVPCPNQLMHSSLTD
jgi:hypothetical protein